MTPDPRVVIDTSAVISALLLPRSIPRQAFDAAHERGRLLVSAATVAELEDVLRRPKFDKYVQENKRLEFLAALVRDAALIEITETVTACRDPRDDKFLAVAINGKASHVMSGDTDLLAMHPFRGIAIVTPQQFLASVPSG